MNRRRARCSSTCRVGGCWWKQTEEGLAPGAEALLGKRFFTKDNKVHVAEMELVGKLDMNKFEWGQVDAEHPLMAFDFRLDELWNTGYTYWDKPTVSSRTPNAFLEIHPADARSRKIADGDWVILKSKYGECKARARVHDGVIEGSVGMVALFPKAGQEFNYVCAPDVSPINGNFDTMVAVQVRKA
jgi:anaerobic selenocysteine-containing dehydrogenase